MTAAAYVITCALGITCAAIGVRRRMGAAYAAAASCSATAVTLVRGADPAPFLVIYAVVALAFLAVVAVVAFIAWHDDIPTDDAPVIAAVDRPVVATLAVLVLSVIAVALLVATDVRRNPPP